jgi:hypothetical protein
MPSNMTVRRSEHVAVAFVSINDEESQAIAKPLTELLDTIGEYLEGPDSEEGAGRVIIGELVDVDRLMKLHTTDIEQGKRERVAAAKRKKGRKLLGARKQRECRGRRRHCPFTERKTQPRNPFSAQHFAQFTTMLQYGCLSTNFLAKSQSC